MVSVATTDEQTSGPNTSMDVVAMTTSATKRAPATGALYAEAMPAAAPHATNSLNRGLATCRMRPIAEANIAASCTSGPSRPIEPPEEIENKAERDLRRL